MSSGASGLDDSTVVPLWAQQLNEKVDAMLALLHAGKHPRLSGNISDISFSSAASFGSTTRDSPSKHGEGEMATPPSGLKTDGKVNKYHQNLTAATNQWKEAKLGDIASILNDSEHFLKLCKKCIPELFEMRCFRRIMFFILLHIYITLSSQNHPSQQTSEN